MKATIDALLRIIGEPHLNEHIAFDAASVPDPQRFPFSIDDAFLLCERLCNEQALKYVGAHANRRPRFAILDSASGSAYAVWTPGTADDWVIFSTALFQRLYAQCLLVGTALSSEVSFLPGVDTGVLTEIRSVVTNELIPSDLVVELLFHATITQIVGHELGHHAYGHDAEYAKLGLSAAPDEATEWAASLALNQSDLDLHALELAADHSGLEWLIGFLSGYKDDRIKSLLLPSHRRMSFCAMAVVCTYAGLGAKAWGKSEISTGKHPVASIRCYAMLRLLRHLLRVASGLQPADNLDEAWWGGTFLAADVIGSFRLMPTLDEGPDASSSAFVVTLHDSLDMVGLKRVFFDEATLNPYLAELHKRWKVLRNRCRPRWRVSEPLPPMPD